MSLHVFLAAVTISAPIFFDDDVAYTPGPTATPEAAATEAAPAVATTPASVPAIAVDPSPVPAISAAPVATPLLIDDPAGEKRALYETAMADYAAGRCEQAIGPLKTLAISGYHGTDAPMVLRACYDKLYGIEGSIEKLRAEITANPADSVAHNNLAVFLMFTRQWDEAQKEVTRAIQLAPGDLDAKLNLAWWYAQVGQSRAAIREHEAILVLDPGNKRSLIELCTLIAERENDPTKALPYCEQHAVGLETNEIAAVTLGLVRMRTGDLDGAEKVFQRVVDANPDARTAKLSLAHLRQYRGDLDGARVIFEESVAANPDDADARLALARLLKTQRDWVPAIKHYKIAYDQTHSGMALGGLVQAYLSKYFLLVIGVLLGAMTLLLWRYLNVRVPQPPSPANAV